VAQRNSAAPIADESDFAPAASQPSEIDDTPEPTDALSKAVADFLKSRNLAAVDAYKDSAHRDELRAYLKEKHFERKEVDPLRKDKPLARALKRAMIVLGQRPATRESRPDEATWLKYLASVYESHPDSTPTAKKKGRGKPMAWPLFPMDRAPWPLLMPLSRPLPLGEARYIWEKFNGEHGPDRFHSYGPYRKFDAEILYELQPSLYHWDSWMDRIVHGGVCTTMCTITIDLHSALCIPSVHAGQPHHANLITYRDDGGKWEAEIQQAFAGGPDVTHAGWFFRDKPFALRMSKTVGSEYHLGLAQGMNVGVKQYIDTRIAVSLFNALPAGDKKTIGATLLSQAIHENPFNPALWYLLAAQTADAAGGLSLAQSAQQHTAGDEKHVEAVVKYWRTLTEFVTREAVLRHPMPADEQAARRVYQFLKTGVHGLSEEEQAPYFHRFEGKTASSS